MVEPEELTIADLVLACIPKSRAITESEFIEKYGRVCARHNVVALLGQAHTSLKVLYKAGKIKLVSSTDGKRIQKA